ncbi:MAG TPA: hypothetical protein VFA17_00475 [Thermoplasmata archaeon]|nr:hypothetical protein [Thermoplasmata archaeon]
MAASARRPAFLDITSLAFSLFGLIGLVAVVYELKTGVPGIPRPLFILFAAMTCSPFYVALVKTPKFPFLVPPIVAILLTYPISTPFGLVYSADPIFNFNFTRQVLDSGFWAPGTGTGFAQTYSFYPLGNVFVAYVIMTISGPPAAVFPWVQSLLRLFAGPAVVYAVGRRLFGVRAAALSVFFYLGTPSILFNSPVQQGMGVIFLDLALLSLVILTQSRGRSSQRRTQLLFMLVAAGVVMTHHLSSYVFAAWLATLAVLMLYPKYRPVGSSVRLTTLFFYFIALLNLYIVAFTYRIFLGQAGTFELVVAKLISPEEFPTATAGTGSLGRTFSSLEVAWLGVSVLGLVLLALIGVRRYRRAREEPFAIANGLVTAVLVLATLPLIVTSFNFIPLRITEFSNIFVAPFAATTLIRWSRMDPFRISRFAPPMSPTARALPKAFAVVLCAGIFMGGNLAPVINMRAFFEPPSARTTESPLYLGSDMQRAAAWARIYFARGRIWGDQLAIDTFSGFADMETDFGSTRLFVASSLDKEATALVRVGDYIVVDRFMLIARPNFFHEPALAEPLNRAQTEKFETDPHLALVYQDGTVAIYRVMIPPAV